MSREQNLVDGFAQLDITLTSEQIHAFTTYYEMLVEKNKVMNLTGITEWEEVVTKHFVDSVALVKTMDLNQPLRVLDMGTGAGFPGIPLKIVFPELEIVLLDSLNKRIIWLREVIEALGLQNITAVHGRAEEFIRQKGNRESYDLVVSRAVANLASLSEYCIPYVKKGGYFVSYKSGTIEEELQQSKKAIHVLGGKTEQVEAFCLPGTDMSRSLVKIKKVMETSKNYPRSAGKPTKEPIQ